jgi:PAS domain S-box-containing protein
MRILIVDDHEVVRRGVRSLLEPQDGFEVCGEAVDGRDAILKATELKPDAIVMDVSMPNLNGLEATREIRRILPDVKILILTQHDIREMMRQALNAGASGYVVKASLTKDLVSALRNILGGNSTFPDQVRPAEQNLDLQEVLQRSVVFEQALRETNERLRLAQQIARVGTFELNIKTGANRWTPEMESLYGLQPGSFPGTQSAWEQLVHPDDRSAVLSALNRAVDEGSWEAEWRVRWPDGSARWLLGRAWLFRDADGNPERFVGANIDITERKRSEERSKRESRLLDLSFDAIVVRDSHDCVRYWNRGAQELYGWTAEEAEGQVTHALLASIFHEPLEEIIATLNKAGRWEGEIVHSRKDGRCLTVMSRWALFRDWETGGQWVLETNTDITKRKAAEEDLRKAIEVLQQ